MMHSIDVSLVQLVSSYSAPFYFPAEFPCWAQQTSVASAGHPFLSLTLQLSQELVMVLYLQHTD